MFKVNRVLSAAYVAFGIAVVGATYMPPAFAQSNTTGTIYGQAPAGATSVVIENLSTGAKRTLVPDASRRFQATAMPPGRYKASLMNGDAVSASVELEVLLGQGTEAVFKSAQLDTVKIVGSVSAIDVANTNNGSTFTAKQLASLPIRQDVDAIIQLAPNTTKADPRYAGGASIGGGAPSENSYYINGFPVTNALTQLGSIELPFSAISQAQVLTGGFGAEFGRSVGGVVNITTKSGGNSWEAGGFMSFEPDALRSKPRDGYYPNTGDPANATTDGTLLIRRGDNELSRRQFGGYVGGPIVKDKLFFYFAGDRETTDSKYVTSSPTASNLATSGFAESRDTNDRYLTKFDWYLTDDHRFELTLFGDNYKSETDYSGYSYATNSRVGSKTYTEFAKNLANVTPSVGGDAQIFKYTGAFTSDLTLTALYGQSQSKHANSFAPYGYNPNLPVIGWTTTGRNPDIGAASYFNPSPFSLFQTIIGNDAKEDTKSFRLDFEYRLGNHTLRAGLDVNRLESNNAGDAYPGGSWWNYASTSNPNLRVPGSTQTISAAGGVPASNGRYYYVQQRIFTDITKAYSDQNAQYIEDRYQVTDNIQVTAGLRNESFKNKNGDRETFLESKNFLSPRLAASWDVAGDSSLKVFGSAGRYSLQIPTHLAVRGASRSTYTRQYFVYTGIDPVTGQPTGKTPISPPYSTNNEYGQAKDARTVSAQGLDPTFQDEITLGIEKALTPEWNGGARITYRKLKATIDDICDPRAFDKYAVDHGIDTTNYGGFGCASFNPGQDNTFLVDYAGNAATTGQYTTVKLSKADLGFPDAKRTYFALDFFVEHPFKNGWYGKVNYTYSKSKGNTEGQTKSDNAQTDVAATSTWDTPELMENINGLLPNDRTHQIKAFGYYQVTPEWMVGANLLAASGRPRNCVGNYGGQSDLYGGSFTNGVYDSGSGNLDYGNVYFFCNQQPSPRGSLGKLPWDLRLDASLTYMPQMLKGLSARVDVFNLFNRQSAILIDETREGSYDLSQISPTYGRVITYSSPRYMKLTLKYDHAF